MSLLSRRLVILAAGAVAALLAWPLSELLIRAQASFPSYLLFIVTSGALYGAFFGLAFGSVDGITGGVSARKWMGLATGAVAGLVAGIVGAFAGQAIFLGLGQYLLQSRSEEVLVAVPLARGLGWAIMGTIIGAAEGLRLRSGKRAGIGALGGFVGGLAGGLAIEYGVVIFGDVAWVRPVGSVLLGLLLATGFAVIERGFLLGTLVLVTGPLRGREYPLPPGRTTVGSAVSDTISLVPYSGVSERHAMIVGSHGELRFEQGSAGAQIRVNEQPVDQATLKYDDVIDVGSARFVLKTP
ncbi:MAG: FHA domain-containing protein [Spirochaetota bacterium]